MEPWVPLPNAEPYPGSSPGYECSVCGRPNPCAAHPNVGKATFAPKPVKP